MDHTGLLPPWLAALWAGACMLIALLHVRHTGRSTGPYRYWHAGHTLMAAGMAYMYLPHELHVLPAPAGTTVFAAAGVAAASVAMYGWVQRSTTSTLWVLAAAEMAVMAYMFLPATSRPLLLSLALACYLGGVGALWFAGTWDHHYCATLPVGAAQPVGQHVSTSAAGPTATISTAVPPATLAGTMRASMVIMPAGMAYMLLAM